MFRTLLIANRGEIACRVARTARTMGLRTVAVYSDADAHAAHVAAADEAIRIGPAPARESYLNIEAILDAAESCSADAVHPGYGFLAENADFARAVEEQGVTFIGPRPETVSMMGDKLAARRVSRKTGLPVIAGTDEPLPTELPLDMAAKVQYPDVFRVFN